MTGLETERMILRPLTADDVDRVVPFFTDPVAMRFSLTGMRDREGIKLWLERALRRYDEDGHGFLAATLKQTGAYVGHAGLLTQEVEGQSEVEIAYSFLRSHWGRGLATEAACACRDYGFRQMGRDRLVSIIVPQNSASRRVAQKVGMHLEREAIWSNVRVLVYAMTREES